MTKNKQRKMLLTGAVSLLCCMVLLAGTFAWTSFSQVAVNEVLGGMVNPGGRLHDDFNGTTGDKNIYVENFTGLTDGKDILVRIRLREYMELGENAGNTADRSGVTVLTQSGNSADITDYSKWDIYKYGESDHFDGTWEWTEGGMGIYMPTFNKNKDSKTADLNGTYGATGEGGTAGVPFSDYHAYQKGDVKKGTEVYDADSNDTEESNPVEGENVTYVKEQPHTAKATKLGTVMSMEQWKTEKNSQPGPYWVYDTDGWAYWAEPLKPQTATGLLLDQIEKKKNSSQKWYYAIYVEGQMVDTDGVGNAEDQTGFYSTEAGGAPTEDAKDLIAVVLAQMNAGTENASAYLLELEQQRKQQQEIRAIYEEILEQEALEAAQKEQTEKEQEDKESTEDPDLIEKDETTPPDTQAPEDSVPDLETPAAPDPENPSDSDPEQPSGTDAEAPSETEPEEPSESEPTEPSDTDEGSAADPDTGEKETL